MVKNADFYKKWKLIHTPARIYLKSESEGGDGLHYVLEFYRLDIFFYLVTCAEYSFDCLQCYNAFLVTNTLFICIRVLNKFITVFLKAHHLS